MATVLKVSPQDWASEDFRRVTLKEARKEARQARKRVIIKVGSHKYGYHAIATVDGRFYVGRVTTLALLFSVSCSGGQFSEKTQSVGADSSVGDANPMGKDSSVLPDVSTRLGGDSGTPSDGGIPSSPNGSDASDAGDARPPRLSCPGSVDSCDGKAWNGNPCTGIYSVCCNGESCSCCLG